MDVFIRVNTEGSMLKVYSRVDLSTALDPLKISIKTGLY